MQLISQNQEEFMRILGEPLPAGGGDIGDAFGGGGGGTTCVPLPVYMHSCEQSVIRQKNSL
jgi:hypothetical protein